MRAPVRPDPAAPRLSHRWRGLLLPSRRAVAVLTALVAGSGLAARADAAEVPASTYVAVVEEDNGNLAVHRVRAASARHLGARLEEFNKDGSVVALAVDRPVQALGGADPYRNSQWALDATSFEAAWPVTEGTGAIVAVLDTGVQGDHEDLAGTVLDGWDAITDRPGGTTDAHGHGTHVAGVITATAGNGVGVSGAAPGVRILPVRVLAADGSGWVGDILEGIIWAADHGADVINLSLGGDADPTTYGAAIRYALAQGALVVAAAGNEALDGNPPSYPAADPGAVAVGATTSSGKRAAFSNHGGYLDLAAPGSGIYSTIPSGYARWSGTSMAAPYASAAAALVAARYPELSPNQIRDLLERSALDLGAPGPDDHFGAGLINPAAAITLGAPIPLPPPPPPPLPPVSAPPVSAPPTTKGYWVVAADGRVQAFGAVPHLGDASRLPLGAPVVAAAPTPTGQGYWLAAEDGAVHAFGDAAQLGSAVSLDLNAPIVGIAATSSGHGYWLLGRDGGIFSFGDAAFYGSTGNLVLNQPVVDMSPTPSGQGYWLVASDGGVFAFGDAPFHGSTGAMRLNRPVVSLTPSTRGGYWMVAADGGIFAFDVPFHGSLPGLAPTGLPEGHRIRATPGGTGYYILGKNGHVFAFGSAADHGSAATLPAVDLILAH